MEQELGERTYRAGIAEGAQRRWKRGEKVREGSKSNSKKEVDEAEERERGNCGKSR